MDSAPIIKDERLNARCKVDPRDARTKFKCESRPLDKILERWDDLVRYLVTLQRRIDVVKATSDSCSWKHSEIIIRRHCVRASYDDRVSSNQGLLIFRALQAAPAALLLRNFMDAVCELRY